MFNWFNKKDNYHNEPLVLEVPYSRSNEATITIDNTKVDITTHSMTRSEYEAMKKREIEEYKEELKEYLQSKNY